MDLSIIIVEYMDTQLLERAIHSIFANVTDLKVQLIVVSNSCYSEKQQDTLVTTFPRVHFLFNENNLGFSTAVNQGLGACNSEYVLLLNPDATLMDRSILNALDFLRGNPRIAVVGPIIVDSSGSVQDSCRKFMTLSILLKRTLTRILSANHGPISEKMDYSKKQQVDWVSGACLLARRVAIDSIGPMDERYFMYLEDMDWCKRFWLGGWEVWFLPDWQVVHDAGRGSTTKFSIKNRLMWIHFISYIKYLYKWSLSSFK